MMSVLVIHRDLKLQNIMLHFPNNEELLNMSKPERNAWLKKIDLTKINFEVKIADFGFSKKMNAEQKIEEFFQKYLPDKIGEKS